MAKQKTKKKPSLCKRLLKGLYILLVVISIFIVGMYIAFELFVGPPDVEAQVTFPPAPPPQSSDSGAPLPTEEPPIVYTRREGVYTCLIAGSDDGNGKADTIMLGCFDVSSKTASLISIPRDTLVNINGKHWKVNAAYGLGGMELVRETVSRTLGIPVDYYVSVDLKAFQRIVDRIGGVWFDVPVDMHYEDPTQDLIIHVDKGYQRLNGEAAMGVVRFRSGYASQDLGRVNTQRQFLVALVKQTVTASNVDKVADLISILREYVKTDMPLDIMLYFATAAVGMDLEQSLSSATLPSDWLSPYLELRDDEVVEMVNRLLPVYTEPVTADIMDIQHR